MAPLPPLGDGEEGACFLTLLPSLLTAGQHFALTETNFPSGTGGLTARPYTGACWHQHGAVLASPQRPRILIKDQEDKLINSALSSLPAVLPIQTEDIGHDRAAGPISV